MNRVELNSAMQAKALEDESAPALPMPIRGAAGAAIHTALKNASLHPGAITLTIKKERLPNGGYVYSVAVQKPQPPARR